jgi:hypothetical protein
MSQGNGGGGLRGVDLSEIWDSPEVSAGSLEVSADQYLPWGDLQSHILTALLDGGEEWESESVAMLAKRMRTSVEELQEVVRLTRPELWMQKRAELLIERENLRRRGYDWDRLEHAVLHKLVGLVEKNRISSASELLAVAKVANQATRTHDSSKKGGNMTQNDGISVQINQINGQVGENGLPGPGSLGTIQLTLTQRTLSQLSRERVIDGEATRLSETVQMLGPEDIPELTGLIEKGKGK